MEGLMFTDGRFKKLGNSSPKLTFCVDYRTLRIVESSNRLRDI